MTGHIAQLARNREYTTRMRAYGGYGTADSARLDPCECLDPSPRDLQGWDMETVGTYAGRTVIAWTQTCRRCGHVTRREFAPDMDRLAEVFSRKGARN